MRMPRVRFTVRRMMVVVAVVGIALGVAGVPPRIAFMQKAKQHELAERRLRKDLMLPGPFDILSNLRWHADKGKREADEARPKWAEAKKALASKRSAGLPTTQAERREAWYWKLKVEEGEWAASEAERE